MSVQGQCAAAGASSYCHPGRYAHVVLFACWEGNLRSGVVGGDGRIAQFSESYYDLVGGRSLSWSSYNCLGRFFLVLVARSVLLARWGRLLFQDSSLDKAGKWVPRLVTILKEAIASENSKIKGILKDFPSVGLRKRKQKTSQGFCFSFVSVACCCGLCVPDMLMTKANAKENLRELICLSITKATKRTDFHL